MSTLEIKNRLPLGSTSLGASSIGDRGLDDAGLQWYEKCLLAVILFEIPLQLDTLLLYSDWDGELGAIAGLNVSIATFAIAMLYVIWLLQWALGDARSTRDSVIGLPMLFYIGTVVISIFAAKESFLAVCDVWLLAQAYLVFAFIANRIRNVADMKFVLLLFCSTVIFQSILIFFARSLSDTLPPGERLNYGPLSIDVGEAGRPGGTLHSPTLAGSYLALMWLPALGMLLSPVKGVFRTAAIATLLLGGMAILVTQTRGAILTTVIGSSIVALCCMSRGWFPTRVLVLAVLLAAAGFFPLMSVIEKRVQGDDSGSAQSRIHLSQIALEVIEDNAFFGVGAGNSHRAALRHANNGKYRSEWFFTVHCKYLLVWAETGALGLFAFLIMLGAGVKDSLSIWLTRNRLFAPIGIGLSIAIIGNMIHMIVDIFNSRPQIHSLWALLGLVAAIRMIAAKASDSEELSEFSNA